MPQQKQCRNKNEAATGMPQENNAEKKRMPQRKECRKNNAVKVKAAEKRMPQGKQCRKARMPQQQCRKEMNPVT
jgi:hypothetical protein